jgi:hypothetical protein
MFFSSNGYSKRVSAAGSEGEVVDCHLACEPESFTTVIICVYVIGVNAIATLLGSQLHTSGYDVADLGRACVELNFAWPAINALTFINNLFESGRPGSWLPPEK